MHVHGDNLQQKEQHTSKYLDAESKQYLSEIRHQYEIWRSQNEVLKGPSIEKSTIDAEILQKRVAAFATYKDFLDQQHYAEKFDSRSNLHSSVLEEFMFYLFRDIAYSFSQQALLGKSHTFKDIFFMPSNFKEMVVQPSARIEKKDHDFVIGASVQARFQTAGSNTVEEHLFHIPAIAIECKTYLDKTMLEGSSTAAEQLKIRSPNALYIVVAEWLKLTESVNLRKFKVDQIYILRKQKNTDREFRYLSTYTKNPVFADVVEHLFNTVRTHLTSEWESGISFGLERGYLL
ncbi:MAG: Bpu10I family restriction endonuclease [Candidatus Kapaibacteriota bacterium]|jgi:hypothetical protein